MEKFLDLLKVFFEKHLIPSILSIIVAIFSIAMTKEDATLLTRLGKPLYGVLFFCITFIIIEFSIWLSQIIKKAINNANESAWLEKENKSKMNEVLDNLWTIVDRMSVQDQEQLMNFIKNENTPICVKGEYGGNCLFTSDHVISTVVPYKAERYVLDADGVFGEKGSKLKISGFPVSIPTRQYKLKENFYQLIKYSYENYGRISHFTQEENKND